MTFVNYCAVIRMAPSTPPPTGSDPHAKRPTLRRKQQVRRQRALTAEAVVEAAIALLATSGIEVLSMRRIAEQLGTGPASLYAYVASKEELLELVFDELAGQVKIPDPDPGRWQQQVHQMLRDFRHLLVAHRGTALSGLGRIPTTPKMLKATDGMAAVLRAGGLADEIVALGLDQLLLFVCADAFEEGILEGTGMTSEEITRYYHDVHAFYTHLPADLYPTLTQVGPHMVDLGIDRFDFGLKLMLAGLSIMGGDTRKT
jgi:AcrR family transcriptional regulator